MSASAASFAVGLGGGLRFFGDEGSAGKIFSYDVFFCLTDFFWIFGNDCFFLLKCFQRDL